MTIFQRWKQTALHNKALVVSGIIVALGTLFYAGGVVVQICIMKRGARETSEQMEKLITAANIQASAATKNAAAAASFAASAKQIKEETADAVGQLRRAARDSETAIQENSRNAQTALSNSIETSKLDQRPWFGVSEFKILQPKQPFRMQIEFKNTSKTPARQIHLFGVFGVHSSRTDGPSDAEWKSFLTFYSQETGRYVAAPNAARRYIVGDFGEGPENQLFRALFTENFSSFRSGSKFLSYFGQATYIDNDDKARTTRFCLVLADIETKQLAHCGRGNDMD